MKGQNESVSPDFLIRSKSLAQACKEKTYQICRNPQTLSIRGRGSGGECICSGFQNSSRNAQRVWARIAIVVRKSSNFSDLGRLRFFGDRVFVNYL